MKLLVTVSRRASVTNCIAIIVTATLLLGTIHYAASAQWRRAAGWSLDAHNGVLSQVKGFTTFGNKLLADVLCATSVNGTPDSLFVSTDNGQSWAPFSANGGVPLIANGTTLMSIADSFSNGFVVQWIAYSTDQGQHWVPDSAGFPSSIYPGGLVFAGNSVIATAGYGGFYKQSSLGAPWMIDTVGSSIGGQIIPVGALTKSGNTILAGAIVAGIMASTDNGASWNIAVSGIPEMMQGGQPAGWPTVWNIGVAGSSVYAMTEADPNNVGTWDLYRSNDDGQNWTLANSTPINAGANGGGVWFAGNDQIIFLSGDSGVFVSKDKGATWTNNNNGLYPYDQTGFYTMAIQVAGGNVVVGTADSGIWYRPLSDFGVSDVKPSEDNTNALRVSLVENPASSAETIICTIPSSGTVSVQLIDELGNTVRMLQNGRAAAGQNSISLDPSTLAPGTYFVRVEANGESAMQKLVISK